MAKKQVDSSDNEPSLIGLIERIESLLEDRDVIDEDIKEIYTEAKATGYDVKIMRKVVARRRRERAEVEEEDAMIEKYEQALADRLTRAGVAV